MLAPLSERLKFLVAFRPGLISPTLAAQMAGDLPALSGGRLLLNVVTGGESRRAARLRRLPRQGRPLRALRRVPRRSCAALGRRDGRLRRASTSRSRARTLPASPDPVPPIYFGGSSPAAGRGRRRARRRLPHLGRAARGGRREGRLDPRAGRRRRAASCASASGCTTITRDTSEEAWAEADRLLAGIDPADDRAACRRGCSAASPRASGGCSRCTRGRKRRAWRSTRTSGPASAWSAAGRAPRWSAATTEVADRIERVRRARHRRVHPLRLPAPRGGLLVR